MTGHEVVPLTPMSLDLLRDPCRGCVRWLRDPVEARAWPEHRSVTRQREWVAQVTETWGPPGVLLRHEVTTIGHAVVAPPRLVARAGLPATGPVSDDAVLLLSLSAESRAAARHVVQVLSRDLVRRRVRAVEAYAGPEAVRGCLWPGGDTGAPTAVPWPPPAVCRVPVSVLLDVGFVVVRDHPTTPRLRLDLRSVATVVDGLGAAIRRWLPARTPAPAATLGVDGGRRSGEPWAQER